MGKQRTYDICESCDKPILDGKLETNEITDGRGTVVVRSGAYHKGCLVKELGHACARPSRPRLSWPQVDDPWRARWELGKETLDVYTTPGSCGGVAPPVTLKSWGGVVANAQSRGLLSARNSGAN